MNCAAAVTAIDIVNARTRRARMQLNDIIDA